MKLNISKEKILKKAAVVLAVCLAAGSLAACGSDKSEATEAASSTTTKTPKKEAKKITASSDSSKTDTKETEKEEKSTETSADAVVWKYSENQTSDYPTTLGAKEFARLVKENTNGQYEVEIHADGEYGDEKDVVGMVQRGEVELMRVALAPLATYYDDLNVLMLPYLYRDSEHMWKVLDGDVGQTFLDNLVDTAQVKGLAWYDSGSRNFYTTQTPIRSAADLKGLKVRVQDNPLMVDMVASLGAEAVPLGYDDVAGALESGQIDGAENNFPSYEDKGHYKTAKYYSLDGHSMIPEMVIMSDKTWNPLDDETKDIVKEAALLSEEVEREEWAKKEEASQKIVEEAGCEIIAISDTSDFQEAVKPLYEKYAGDKMDILEQIQNVE